MRGARGGGRIRDESPFISPRARGTPGAPLRSFPVAPLLPIFHDLFESTQILDIGGGALMSKATVIWSGPVALFQVQGACVPGARALAVPCTGNGDPTCGEAADSLEDPNGRSCRRCCDEKAFPRTSSEICSSALSRPGARWSKGPSPRGGIASEFEPSFSPTRPTRIGLPPGPRSRRRDSSFFASMRCEIESSSSRRRRAHPTNRYPAAHRRSRPFVWRSSGDRACVSNPICSRLRWSPLPSRRGGSAMSFG